MAQTLGAAHDLFAERGYAAVTMDEIAAAAGVTNPLLYNYFGNKERLYLACMEPAAEALLATVLEAVERTSTPTEALRSGMHAFFAFLDEDRAAWRVLFDETLPVSGEISVRVEGYRERLAELVVRAILTQTPTRPRAEVEALSTLIMGAAEALGRWWLRTEAIPAHEAAELLITTIEPGLRARSEGRNR